MIDRLRFRQRPGLLPMCSRPAFRRPRHGRQLTGPHPRGCACACPDTETTRPPRERPPPVRPCRASSGRSPARVRVSDGHSVDPTTRPRPATNTSIAIRCASTIGSLQINRSMELTRHRRDRPRWHHDVPPMCVKRSVTQEFSWPGSSNAQNHVSKSRSQKRQAERYLRFGQINRASMRPRKHRYVQHETACRRSKLKVLPTLFSFASRHTPFQTDKRTIALSNTIRRLDFQWSCQEGMLRQGQVQRTTLIPPNPNTPTRPDSPAPHTHNTTREHVPTPGQRPKHDPEPTSGQDHRTMIYA